MSTPGSAVDGFSVTVADPVHVQHDVTFHSVTVNKARGHHCMFLPKFHCKLNPIEMVCSFIYSHTLANYWIQYWGWCKQQYRDVPKDRLDVAKRVACECLDKCPVEVIWCFFNKSWRFMTAYHAGLTRKAAEWAVRKQKSHRRVGPEAMMLIDAIVN